MKKIYIAPEINDVTMCSVDILAGSPGPAGGDLGGIGDAADAKLLDLEDFNIEIVGEAADVPAVTE